VISPRALLLPALLAAGCAGTPPPAPTAPDTCVVAVALRTNPERDAHRGRPQAVYFVRAEEDVDIARLPEVVPSDYYADGVYALLNAAPGRYAVVGCHARGDGREWNAYFAESLIRASEQEVGPGEAVVLGSFDIDLKSISTEGDAAQEHYLRVISPSWQRRATALKLFTRDEHAWGKRWRDRGDAAEVRARLRDRLGPPLAGRFD